MIKCTVCNIAFKEGDQMQAFLRCPDDPEGNWTTPVDVDASFQKRAAESNLKPELECRRKHSHCGYQDRPMLIDKVCDAIIRLRAKAVKHPFLVVYMERQFYLNCKDEVVGHVSYNALVFGKKDTVMGYPLFVVTSQSGQPHPNFRVIEVDDNVS